MKRLILLVTASVAAIAAIFLVVSYVSSKSVSIPEEYFQARIEAAQAANRLNSLVAESLANLGDIEALDRANRSREALVLIQNEINTKQERQLAAVEFAASLETMAHTAEAITPAETARRLAIENISTGVTMVSRMITYNSYLDDLFSVLQKKLQSGKTPRGITVRELITDMNEQARAINRFNSRFVALQTEFDEKFVQ